VIAIPEVGGLHDHYDLYSALFRKDDV